MLEIRRGSAVRTYENTFFREFAKNLARFFEETNIDGVLIGNPICIADSRLQIDALLITENVVCIIDFKNYKGEVILPSKIDFDKKERQHES